MKKIFAIIFIILLHTYSFSYTPLQIVIENENIVAPPPPSEEGTVAITPFDVGQGNEKNTPIDFIVPFLLITVLLLVFFILKNKREKLV